MAAGGGGEDGRKERTKERSKFEFEWRFYILSASKALFRVTEKGSKARKKERKNE